jgi:hypothetical protein
MDNNQPIGILTQALAALQYGKRFTIFPMKNIQTVRMRLMAKKSKEEIVALSIKKLICYLK